MIHSKKGHPVLPMMTNNNGLLSKFTFPGNGMSSAIKCKAPAPHGAGGHDPESNSYDLWYFTARCSSFLSFPFHNPHPNTHTEDIERTHILHQLRSEWKEQASVWNIITSTSWRICTNMFWVKVRKSSGWLKRNFGRRGQRRQRMF